MKKLLLLALATCFAFSIAAAQTPGYFLTYGNQDGSDLSVGLDADIEVAVWYASPAGNDADSVNFCHIPLASDDLYITARNGGTFGYPFTDWDDVSFLGASPDNSLPGWTYQGILGFADLGGGPNPFLNTGGATWQVATHMMHTTADPAYLNMTVVAFASGDQGAPNNGITFGLQDGVTIVTPLETFSSLFFSPNQDPEWTDYPSGTVMADAGLEVCFFLAGTDADEDELTISEVTSYGTVTEYDDAPGAATATFCATFGSAGTYVVSFELNDGSVGVVIDVTVDVTEIALGIDCPGAFPGGEVLVPVSLETGVFEMGGFEVLVGWDNTALTLLEVIPAERIDYGSEYFHVNLNDGCQDCPNINSARVVWISDINNGVPHSPAPAGGDPVFYLRFSVDASLPFGMLIPIEFITNDYTDNTISDESGYIFWHPVLNSGCVTIVDPESYKGDPNMNCYYYEIGDAVLVARRLIEGYGVWGENADNCHGLPGGTDDDALQESAGDLNNNGVVDIADLVTFINIINGNINPPKLDPATSAASITMPNVIGDNMEVSISSGLEVGGVLLSINHNGIELGAPIAANGMDVRAHDADGVMHVVVYSLDGHSLPAGTSTLFTLPVISNNSGSIEFAEASVSDTYGRLLETSASLVAPLPTEFAVAPNYPNPFNAKTLISFALPVASDVNVSIYNLTGQLVESMSGRYEAGAHSITWDASNVSSGVYFYKVSAGEFNQTMKMTLLK